MTRTRGVLVALIVLVGLAGAGVAWFAREGATVDRGVSSHPGPVRGVDVQIDAGRVDVVAGPPTASDAKVERVRHYLRTAPTITETFVDGVVRLRASCPGFVALACAVDIRVEAPAATPVRIRTGSGAVGVDGMGNGVDVATSSGAVRLTRVTGTVKAATSAGPIVGVDLAPSALDGVTSAGDIRVSLAQPASRVDLHTGGGGIDLALPVADGGYRVTTKTGSGKPAVSVAQDPSSGRAVSAQTGSGRIRIHPR
jgi:DUF4097 and DUF4098 domain-containing protein YvlB